MLLFCYVWPRELFNTWERSRNEVQNLPKTKEKNLVGIIL